MEKITLSEGLMAKMMESLTDNGFAETDFLLKFLERIKSER